MQSIGGAQSGLLMSVGWRVASHMRGDMILDALERSPGSAAVPDSKAWSHIPAAGSRSTCCGERLAASVSTNPG